MRDVEDQGASVNATAMPNVFWVEDPKAEEALKKVGRKIKEMMPEGYGFSLLVFAFNKEGGMFYMSSAERSTMIEAMKEFITNAESEL